jgi:hypothetical protein
MKRKPPPHEDQWLQQAGAALVRERTLEELLTLKSGFGLTTASPVQRAVCRIIDGRPLGALAADPFVKSAIGDPAALPKGKPDEVLIISGIRTAKSLTAAATSVRASQICDMSGLGDGEVPRVSIVSLTTDLARVVFDHLLGNILARPALRAILLEEPSTDSLLLRHPSGRPVEIKVVAGARAGASLVARWSAGCIFDEAPRMVGSEDGVVNYDDCHAAVLGRLLPGAQIISIGSPWAPFGPIYNRVIEFTGKPSKSLVVVRAPAHHMNPVTWTADKIAELRTKNEAVYRTDILGEFADPSSSLFSSGELERVTRKAPAELPFESGFDYGATMDPATRGNAWTFTVGAKKRGTDDFQKRIVVVLAKQWIGSKVEPLSPDTVMREIAATCKTYGIDVVTTDQYAADALRDIAERYGLALRVETITAQRKVELFQDLQTKIGEESIELPPDPVLRADLLSVRKRVTQNGIGIELPKTSDGRHADYAPAVALLASIPLRDPDPIPDRPKFGTPEYWRFIASPQFVDALEADALEREAERVQRAVERQWDDKWNRPDEWWENAPI